MDDVVLIDAGDGRRLEQLGPRLVDRPAPAAEERRRAPDRWGSADLRFDPSTAWRSPRGSVDPAEPWPVDVHGLTLELRPTASGGVGLYPEHAANLDWLARAVAARLREGDPPPPVLNLFAHTGLATLALARAGAAVVHVDSARSVVAWARRNAERSGLADRPVRWLVDDAVAFVEREGRRGRRYAGIVLDPPTFGHSGGGGGRQWRFTADLSRLLDACAAVATPDAFVLLSAHATGLEPQPLADAIRAAFGGGRGGPTLRAEPMALRALSGARLDLGWAIRLDPLDGAP